VANTKLSALTSVANVASTDEMYVNDAGVSKKVAFSDLTNSIATITNSTGVIFEDGGAGPPENVLVQGVSVAKTSAPSRGIVSRDNTCFAWGYVSVDITGNTATLTEGHNVTSVTWSTDQLIQVAFHNSASSANHAITITANYATTTYYSNVAVGGFDANFGSAPGGNYTFGFTVFTKDLSE
jgi:hypothetical protein